MARWAVLLLVVVLGWAGPGGAAAGADGLDSEAGELFYLAAVETSPSEILTPAEIETVTAAYTGRMVGFADLVAITERLNQLYLEKGYVTARAVLEPQTIEGGVVRVTLVEGRVGEIAVQNNRSTRDDYIRSRISLRPGDLVRLDVLRDDIVRFNATNDAQIGAEIKAGSEFGTSDLVLHVFEPPRWTGGLYYTNSGRSETGTNQMGVTLASRSLFGLRDPLSLNVVWSEGTVGGSLSYQVPASRLGSRIGIGYHRNQIEVVHGEFEAIEISGDSSGTSVSFIHPLIVRAGTKLVGSVEYQDKESGTYFFGAKLIGGRVRTIGLNLSYQRSTEGRVIILSQSASMGTSSSGGDAERFSRFNTAVTGHWQLGPLYQLTLRGSVQFTGDYLLPSSEQVYVGGESTVRGLGSGQISGDKGYFVNVDVKRRVRDGLEVFAFVDHGAALPYRGEGKPLTEKDRVTSAGVGLNFALGKYVSGRVLYGVPLQEWHRPEGGRGRAHFFVQLGF